MSGESMDFAESPAAKWEKGPYDSGSRDMASVLHTMLFYDAAGGRKRTSMANDYQGFTDLSGLLKAGRAILVGHAAARRLLPRRRPAPRSRAQARRTRHSPAPGQCPGPPHDHLPFRPSGHPDRCE